MTKFRRHQRTGLLAARYEGELVHSVSRTAIGVGMLRAMHRHVDAEPWVIDDTVSVELFGEVVRAKLAKEPAWFRDERVAELRGHILIRSAFAEARLRAAIENGVRQCVLLGAGFDTFAYRQPAWMEGVCVFEVDAPATQREKRRRLVRAAIAEPKNVRFAPIDFDVSSLAQGLSAAGFNPSLPAFFSWLGVMVYLTRNATVAVFRYVASLPLGSEIVFTFTQRGGVEALARRVSQIGEPLRTRIDAEEIEPLLRDFGFRGVKLLHVHEARRLLGERRDALRLPRRESIAAAIV